MRENHIFFKTLFSKFSWLDRTQPNAFWSRPEVVRPRNSGSPLFIFYMNSEEWIIIHFPLFISRIVKLAGGEVKQKKKKKKGGGRERGSWPSGGSRWRWQQNVATGSGLRRTLLVVLPFSLYFPSAFLLLSLLLPFVFFLFSFCSPAVEVLLLTVGEEEDWRWFAEVVVLLLVIEREWLCFISLPLFSFPFFFSCSPLCFPFSFVPPSLSILPFYLCFFFLFFLSPPLFVSASFP